MNFTAGSSLDRIRSELIRLEDSIIFSLIERAQFALNRPVYVPNSSTFDKSFLDLMIDEIEAVHAKFRRYTSPDEYPFSHIKLPDPILPILEFPQILKPNDININDKIKDCYINHILPMISEDRDDGNYGSAATRDIEALQLISRRIHFGKFVAEAKFNDPKLHDHYVELINVRDKIGILKLLTVTKVEEELLVRVQQKALIYGQEVIVNNQGVLALDSKSLKISLKVIKKLYKDIIIPMTKDVEVEYLLQRCQ